MQKKEIYDLGKVLAINISPLRGTEKNTINEAKLLVEWGLEGDAHGGDWDRQVSIFPIEALAKVPKNKKEEVEEGGYTENITISGIPLEKLTVGKILEIGTARIKLFYIGKEEFKENGRPYIVSREGRFGRVIKSGKIKKGDQVKIID